MLLYSLKLRRKLRKMKLKLSKILRKAIEEATYRREIKRLKENIETLKPILANISMEDVIKSIREDREKR
jgi:uncharacterized protein YihD (DUF1040 family)